MPDTIVHGTLVNGAAREIGATANGRLKVEAAFLESTASTDSFGRLRVSNAFTLFDSSHRFSDNGLWATAAANGGAATFNASQGLVDLSVTTASGSEVLRETKKVFAYQPGKSLLTLDSFAFAPAKTNLRQRFGYFGSENGIYIQQDDAQISFVLRSKVSGSVVNTPVAQSSWNGEDRLDGGGPSGETLDLSKSQIFWLDLEWLGVGTVRCGFVINGRFVHCHSFHHANIISATYITTACLPLRYEITNTGVTASASTLKQICSTVLSEGGYVLRGDQRAIGTLLSAPYDLTAAGVRYPVASIRLKASPNRLDAIVIPTAISVLGDGNNGIYAWEVVQNATTSGGTWSSVGSGSAVEYNISGSSTSGGTVLARGYFSSAAQGTTSVDILKEALFAFQLRRNGLTNSPEEFGLVVEGKVAGHDVYGSLDFEEITR